MTHPYARAAYAEALAAAEGGRAVAMPGWPGFAILRPVHGGLVDAVGPYPRAPLTDVSDLDLGPLREVGAVSAVLVPDPMHAPPEAVLRAAFDLCRPFKTHFVADRRAGADWPSAGHRYKVRKARRACRVACVQLAQVMDDWRRLYAGLAQRHAIGGAADFTPKYFDALAADPAFQTFAAVRDDRIVAMGVWFEHEGAAVYHLGASDAAGYAVGASYALFDAAFEHFAAAERFDLGGAAGIEPGPDDGLARFKLGFANREAMAYVCGSVLDPAAYARLTAGRAHVSYFPAYRAPETRTTAAA